MEYPSLPGPRTPRDKNLVHAAMEHFGTDAFGFPAHEDPDVMVVVLMIGDDEEWAAAVRLAETLAPASETQPCKKHGPR